MQSIFESIKTDYLLVTQTKSHIARNKIQYKNLIGLGLGKIGRSRVLQNTSSIQGMIYEVRHLVEIEEYKSKK